MTDLTTVQNISVGEDVNIDIANRPHDDLALRDEELEILIIERSSVPSPVNLDLRMAFGLTAGVPTFHLQRVLLKSGLVALCQDTPIGTTPTKILNVRTPVDIDADIKAGGAGGLDTGDNTETSNRFYNIYLIASTTGASSASVMMQLQPTSGTVDPAPILPSTHDVFRRIGTARYPAAKIEKATNINGKVLYVDETAAVTSGTVDSVQTNFLTVNPIPTGDSVAAIPRTSRRGIYTTEMFLKNTTGNNLVEVFFGNPDYVSGATGGVNLHNFQHDVAAGATAYSHSQKIPVELDLNDSQQFAFRTTSDVPSDTSGPDVNVIGYFENL